MTHKRNRISGLLAAVLLLASVLNVQSKDDDDKSKKENVGTVIGIDLGTTYSWSAFATNRCKHCYVICCWVHHAFHSLSLLSASACKWMWVVAAVGLAMNCCGVCGVSSKMHVTKIGLDCAVFYVPTNAVPTNALWVIWDWEMVFTGQRPNQQYQSTEGKSTKEKSNNVNNKIHICIHS